MADTYRIISLCPSTTFHLFDLGLADQIVGRTKFCIEPKGRVESIQKVGGTKTPKFDLIKSLNPSHIMFNREENEIDQLAKVESIAETIITTPVDIESSLEQNRLFGEIFGRQTEAERIEEEIRSKLERIKSINFPKFSYLYVIWNDPIMIAGVDTYISELLTLVGGENAALKLTNDRYPQLTRSEIESLNADIVFLSSEPFPFKEKHRDLYRFAGDTIKLIDGQALSWHGSYTRIGLDYLLNYFS
ncbi:MAG: ABC transporter substrate-binding protein [Calditrichaeota bacterium]|nr:ABC transporter substrate-binding protein [Calditrichota bacterium]